MTRPAAMHPVNARMRCVRGMRAALLLAAAAFLAAAACNLHAQDASPPVNSETNQSCAAPQDAAIAARLKGALDADGFPRSYEWKSAPAVGFCRDWQGEHPDAARETQVRLLWSPEYLYLRFEAKYRDIFTFPDRNQRRDELWTRDVAEVFLQPAGESGHFYKEIEVSPNGDWLDLDIVAGKGSNLNCGMKTRAAIHADKKIWVDEAALPMSCLIDKFDPKQPWRVNFFRVEGAGADRFFSSWHPTNAAQPNFHVPEVFGVLRFVER